MWKFLIIGCLLQAPWTTLQQQSASETMILESALANYDNNNRPIYKGGGPVKVDVNLYLRYFQQIDSSMEENELELTFRQKWNDPRFIYNETGVNYVSIRDIKKLWVPDLFFSNSKSGFFHDLMEPNTLIRIYPNGDILFSRRVSVLTRCYTDWRYFPFALIKCPLIIASYGYTTDSMTLEWKEKDPVQITKKILSRPHALHMREHVTKTCNSKTITGEYACLSAEFIFDLRFGPYFATLYLPSMVSVLLAWLSFWLDRKSGSASRLTLLVFCLTMSIVSWLITMYQSPVAYITNSSHVWSGCSVLFTLFAFLHYYFTSSVACCRKFCGLPEYAEDIGVLKPMIDEAIEENAEKPSKKTSGFSADHLRQLVGKKRNRPDFVGRILYPCLYLLFNIIFWAVYNEKTDF